MNNPVLVEVLRGDTIESAHCGAVAVVDADGVVVQSLGDIARPVFPRSAVKALQALPLVESGSAERFRLKDA
jgi:L-asparaginase II